MGSSRPRKRLIFAAIVVALVIAYTILSSGSVRNEPIIPTSGIPAASSRPELSDGDGELTSLRKQVHRMTKQVKALEKAQHEIQSTVEQQLR